MLKTSSTKMTESLFNLCDNSIYCAGGLSTDMYTLSNFEMLDMSIGRWQKLPNMNTPHFNTTGFMYSDTLYVLGGRDGKKFTGFCECFDFRANNWRNLPKVPDEYRNIFNSSVQINNHIYLIGGLNEIPIHGFSNLVYRFDLEKEKWEKLPNILKPRADFGAFAVDDKLLIAGGMGQLQGLSATVEIFTISSNKWSLVDDMPTVHASSTKCVDNKSMYLVSGISNTGPSRNVTEIKF